MSRSSTGLGWPGDEPRGRRAEVTARGLGWPVLADAAVATADDPVAGGAEPLAERTPASDDARREHGQGPLPPVLTAAQIAAGAAGDVPSVPDVDAETPIAVLAQAAVRAQLRPPLPRPAATRVMVVANQKGGVGKTTTAVNVAAALALHGLRTLVVDVDPQGNASTALGVEHHADVPSVYEVLIEDAPMASVVQVADGVDRLSCVPATIHLAGAEIELVSMVARESRLRRALQAYLVESAAAGDPYDYVVIDCPPSLGLLTVNALVGGDEVFIPIQCEYYALEGVTQLLSNVELVRAHLNPGLRVSTVLLTMYDARTRLAAQVADEVRMHFGRTALDTTIPRSVRISEAPSYGQTVMTYDPSSSGALSYQEAAREIARRGAAPELAAPEPAVTEPAAPELAAPELAVTEPAVTEPAVTEPAVTEPAVTEPAETSRPATPMPAAVPAAGRPIGSWEAAQ